MSAASRCSGLVYLIQWFQRTLRRTLDERDGGIDASARARAFPWFRWLLTEPLAKPETTQRDVMHRNQPSVHVAASPDAAICVPSQPCA